jgi:hypothetical protein
MVSQAFVLLARVATQALSKPLSIKVLRGV